MTAISMRAAVAAVGLLALGGCTLPHAQYAPSADYPTRPAAETPRPQYPVDAPTTTAQHSADPHDPVPQPSPPVAGAPLPPPAPAASGPVSLNGARFLFASTPWRLVTTPAAYHHPKKGKGARTKTAPAKLTKAERLKELRAIREREERLAHLRGRHLTPAERRAVVRETEASTAGNTRGAPSAVRSHKGDRVNEVAARYGVSVEALMRANHFHHPNGVIPPGTKVIIPAAPASVAERETTRRSSTKIYRAQRGDTIYAIGRKFKVTPREIEALNGFSPSTHLKTGQIVKLPGPPVVERVERHVAAAPEPLRERPESTDVIPPTTNGPVPYTSLTGARPTTPPERPYVAPVVQPTPLAPLGPPDAQVLLAGRGRFIWPVHGPVLTAFGPRSGGQRSDGLDIGAPMGAPVRAAATGEVVYAGALPDLGNLVLLKHEDGWITAYAHLSHTDVKIKDHVSQGQQVGEAGQSGAAAQPEVYFEIRYAPTPRDKAKPVDPALLLAGQ
ncbi:MAG TPA: peptidoglycan DD-metalloendopeptidase family protein [Caulobacteraceae bacterium]|nr:peptidoglycan DD-metalloendopeptidase family protein [Caulobacteraceae bacterium]